jgi:hypothetical protein
MKQNVRKLWFSVLLVALSLAGARGALPIGQQNAKPAQQSETRDKQSAAAQQPQPSSTGETQESAESTASATNLNLPPTNDAKEIVRRALETDHRTVELARNYTFQLRQVVRHVGKDGKLKSTEIKTYDINFYYGEEYTRLVQVDDKSLSESEQKKEDEKLEKFLKKYRDESDQDREKRLEKERKQREEGRAFVRDVVNAYDFRLLGEEHVAGADTWVIEGSPRKDFKPTQPHADILKKIQGRLWIEKKGYNWVKVEAEATDTISYGLFLFRIHPGSRFVFEKTLVNNEVWLPSRLEIKGGARIALFKNEYQEIENVTSNFKKFVSSVKILPGVREVPEEQKK